MYKRFRTDKIQDLAQMTERGQRVLHGDVIIIRCDEADMPSNFDSLPDAKNQVLAEGEHSGHAHALFQTEEEAEYAAPTVRNFQVIEGGQNLNKGTFRVKVTANGEMYLKVENQPVLLKHQEHTPFRIYPGNYEIGIQQEVWDDLKRAVID